MSDLDYFPVPSFYFAVQVGRFGSASFQEITGLEVQLEVEHAAGGNDTNEAPAPTKRKFSNLTLKRGLITRGAGFHDWIYKSFHPVESKSMVDPQDIFIELLDVKTKAPIMIWNAIGAYPIKWSFSALNSQKNEILVETVELVLKELKIISVF